MMDSNIIKCAVFLAMSVCVHLSLWITTSIVQIDSDVACQLNVG